MIYCFVGASKLYFFPFSRKMFIGILLLCIYFIKEFGHAESSVLEFMYLYIYLFWVLVNNGWGEEIENKRNT